MSGNRPELNSRDAQGIQAESGFVLVTTALCLVAVVAVLGLVLDVGRMYIVKAELQFYTDSAAMDAAYALNGTAQGISNALLTVQGNAGTPSGDNRWNFGTQAVSGAQTTFSTSVTGPFVANPVSAANVVFARVTASASIPIFFLPILPAIGTTTAVSASSTAGQIAKVSLGSGLTPFSPDAHSTTDSNYGFIKGQQYTLRWPPPGQQGKAGNSCSGDVGFTPAGGSSDRGYADVGQGRGNSAMVSTIVDNNFYLSAPLRPGDTLSMLTGQGSIGGAVDSRVSQDTDTTSSTFAAYSGNGRRIIIVPVNNHSASPQVLGFGGFFLPPSPCGTKNTSVCCAEYIGAAVEFADHAGGATGGGVYQVLLVQ